MKNSYNSWGIAQIDTDEYKIIQKMQNERAKEALKSIDSGAHYRYEFKGVKLDPYRIMDLYKITHPAHQHALKKLLRAGRSVKDQKQDIQEVIDSLNRWLEMMQEDEK